MFNIKGYFFQYKAALANDVISWRCQKNRTNLKCPAFIKTLDGIVIQHIKSHNHQPETDSGCRIVKLNDTIKQELRKSQCKPLKKFIRKRLSKLYEKAYRLM